LLIDLALALSIIPNIRYTFRTNLIDRYSFVLKDIIDTKFPACTFHIYEYPPKSSYYFIFVQPLDVQKTVDMTSFYKDVFSAKTSSISFDISLDKSITFKIITDKDLFALNIRGLHITETCIGSSKDERTNLNISVTFNI
jgi:hypothetical protein